MRMTGGDGGDKIRWGTIIPLIGGSAIGCQQATGSLPDFHLSYSAFTNNEKHLRKYWPSVPFHYIDRNQPAPSYENVDFINSVCPCAGLSMLNTSNSGSKKRGADAEANRWMYESSIYVLSRVKPKVLWGENAPGLFTNIGEGVIEKLREIGKHFGYSFSVMRTNTEQHGIPQSRLRTFYFFWKSPTVPEMEYSKRERQDVIPYLEDIPAKATQQDLYLTHGKASERFRPYQFVLERLGKTHEEFAAEFRKGTITGYLEKNELIDECIEWLKEKYPTESVWQKTGRNRTHIMYLEHVKRKRDQGLGYWDDSPRFMNDGCFATVMKKTMMWGIHPKEDRFLSAREYMHLMGLPHDFEIDDERSLNHIAQNVPTCTARDMAAQVVKFINGELPMTDKSFMKQDNILGRITEAEQGEVDPVRYEEVWNEERIAELFKTLMMPSQVKVEDVGEVKIKPKKKERVSLSEAELQIRKIDREIAREKKREERKKEKEMIKAEKQELKRRKKSEIISEREQKREQKKAVREAQTRLRPVVRTDNSNEVTWETASEDQRRFACYICRIFPRPGSFNRSELYRHYSNKHFSKEIKDSFLSKHSLPCQCPFCPEDSGKVLTTSKNFITHLGQVHCQVERFLHPDYHLSGDTRRTVKVEEGEEKEVKVKEIKVKEIEVKEDPCEVEVITDDAREKFVGKEKKFLSKHLEEPRRILRPRPNRRQYSCEDDSGPPVKKFKYSWPVR